jgi:hypothetical protein
MPVQQKAAAGLQQIAIRRAHFPTFELRMLPYWP